MQSSDKVHVVQVPSLPSSPLCLVQALKNLLIFVPASKHSPLPKPSGLYVLTSSMISATLSRFLLSLKLDPQLMASTASGGLGCPGQQITTSYWTSSRLKGVGPPLLFKSILKTLPKLQHLQPTHSNTTYLYNGLGPFLVPVKCNNMCILA